MKVVTWNCNGALRKKTEALDALGCDILVIQECEDPARSTQGYKRWADNYLWVGQNKNKGIGVFARNAHKIENLNWYGEFEIQGLLSTSDSIRWSTNDLELFLPVKINDELTLLACWTKGGVSQSFRYIGQLWKYLQVHRSELSSRKTMIMGDLNSNARWDRPDRWWSHTDTVNELVNLGVYSLYHRQMGEEQGQESQPTFYLQKNKSKPYHIDYVFMSDDLIDSGKLAVGNMDDWLDVSDHMPLIVEVSTSN